MDNSLVEWGAFVLALGIVAIVVAYFPALQVDPRISSLFLWSGVIAIIAGILLAALGMSTEPQPMSIATVPSWKPGVFLFLAIMGIVVPAFDAYNIYIRLRDWYQLSFFDLPLDQQGLILLEFLTWFSIGFTEIAVAWLLEKSRTSEEKDVSK